MVIHFIILHNNAIDKEIVDGLITININDGSWKTPCINGLRWAAIWLSNELLFPYEINVTYYNKFYKIYFPLFYSPNKVFHFWVNLDFFIFLLKDDSMYYDTI